MHNEQANSDFYLFSELFRDYICLIGCVKVRLNLSNSFRGKTNPFDLCMLSIYN